MTETAGTGGEKRAVLYDKDIREPLFDYLEERFGKTRIFEEKMIGRSRADILMLTESQFVGLEIKSDADTYERLKRQVRDYDKYCDVNYVTVGKSHEKHVEKHVPDYWGILLVSLRDGRIVIEEKREAKRNPKVKKERQITFIWRPELQHLLEINHLPKYKQKSKKFVQQKLMEKMDWETLKLQMCEELFERDYTIAFSQL
ncbi:hypothetical protein DXA13_09270 [Clostridium sp. AM58-1XD]|nr:hypothetical protein DXA13_09270 [Clostridium sp. AM58-1XD]